MKLSEQLKQLHETWNYGLCGLAERAALLEDAILAMVADGWLYHGAEGMSEEQEKCHKAYLDINENDLSLDGWIDAEQGQPPLVEDRSDNVWGFDGERVLVVSFFVDADGWHWANAYGNVFGEAEFDDDYAIRCWQPIIIPNKPF